MTAGKDFTIYCDGAWKIGADAGGWGAVIISGNDSKNATEICGGTLCTTNNQMEMIAALRAIESINKPSKIIVFSDSQYLVKGMTTWMKDWKRKGWVTRTKEPVKNIDLWKSLDKICEPHDVTWKWVKGHSGNWGNERADKLANMGVNKAKIDHPKPPIKQEGNRVAEPTTATLANGSEMSFGFDELIAGMNKRLKRHGRTEEVIVGNIVGYQVIQKNGLSCGGLYRSTSEIPKGTFDPEIDILRPVYAQAL